MIRRITNLAIGILLPVAFCFAQVVTDDPGVTVELNGLRVTQREPIRYSGNFVEGTVIANLSIDGSGDVLDVSIVSGPPELRKPVLLSLLNWRFSSETANTTRQITVTFLSKTISRITIRDVDESQRSELLSRLPVSTGDKLTPEAFITITRAVRDWDIRFQVLFNSLSETETWLEIFNPEATPHPEGPIVRVSPAALEANLLTRVDPYSPNEKGFRVHGIVRLEILVAIDGTVSNIHLISGHPLLVQSAMNAVRQYIYRPFQLNGKPANAVGVVEVPFALKP